MSVDLSRAAISSIMIGPAYIDSYMAVPLPPLVCAMTSSSRRLFGRVEAMELTSSCLSASSPEDMLICRN